MHRNPLDAHPLLRATLLIHLALLQPPQRLKALLPQHLAENGVQPVQMRRLVKRDEELRAVRPGALVGHGHDAALRVLQRWLDFVTEDPAPDAATAFGVVGWGGDSGRAGLRHEGWDEPVEGRGVVVV